MPNLKNSMKNARVAVIGLARSGVAAVKSLSALGARVVVNDARSEAELAPALEELRNDPSVHIEEAVLGGHPDSLAERVEMMVISPGVPYDLPFLVRARERGIPTIGELELAYQLSESAFIAITGTKGKSTTTTLVGTMLDGNVPAKVRVAGNIGIPLSLEVRELSKGDFIVAEVSSFQLESIIEFRPRIAVVINLSPDHLDRHRTMDAYIAAKKRIVENQQPDDLLILNGDVPVLQSFAGAAKSRVICFSTVGGVSEGAFLRGNELVWRMGGNEEILAQTADIRIPGTHHVANALAAAAVAKTLGVSAAAIRETLRAFRGLEHVFESVGTVRNVHYINDTKATNVAAVMAAVNAVPCENGARIVLIMGGTDKGNDYTTLAPLVAAKTRHLVLLGLDTRRLQETFAGIVPFTPTTSMKNAVEVAASVAQAGDTVLLSPGHASFDLFRDWKDRGNAFRQAVRSLE